MSVLPCCNSGGEIRSWGAIVHLSCLRHEIDDCGDTEEADVMRLVGSIGVETLGELMERNRIEIWYKDGFKEAKGWVSTNHDRH